MEPFEQLESEWGDWICNPNTVACSSGTSALTLALEALRLPQGSQVATNDFSMVACARAITMAGLQPEFIDCGKDLLINTDLLRMCSSPRLRAILVVHVYGRRCNMDAIASFAHARGLAVIEDLAEAHGVRPHPNSAAACWSFFRNKIVNGNAEGGIISFRDSRHVKIAKQLRCLGFTDEHNFRHIPRGINARMSNLHAAPVIESLRNAGKNILRREKIEKWYNARIPIEWQMPKRDVVWVMDLRIPGMLTAQQDRIVSSLNKQGIAARHGFYPLSLQEEYRYLSGGVNGNSEALLASHEVIYLPVDPSMDRNTVDRIANALLSTVDCTILK